MDFRLRRLNLNAVAQGVGGLVFGSEQSSSNEDRYVQRYLDRISNGVLAEDRRSAMVELQSLVAESRSAQLAFSASGLPVVMTVLREEREDVELIRGALETLVSAVTSIDTMNQDRNEVHAASMNADLLSREPESIPLLINLLSEDDFYIRYYTLQLLTALLSHSHSRLQETILSVPRGITCLMDMLMDREVIRNEALLLLTHLTREAEEIQKIVVFEGAFEKIFSIIKEEGGSEGGVVVQDSLELLKNLIRKNASNQILLRETIGFEPLISILKLHRGSAYNFTQQKTINLLSALETVDLLLIGGPEGDPGKDANRLSNQTTFAQRKILDHLLMLGVESQWASLSVRCLALRCIGDLVYLNPQNCGILSSKVVGEEPQVEPALNSILRIILRTSTVQEFISADHVFKCFCERNNTGQAMLVSTMSSPLHSASTSLDSSLPFGSMLLHGLLFNETNGDIETSCRAASVLFHILKDNIQCKEQVLRVVFEAPVPSLGTPEPLMHRLVKYCALATSSSIKDNDQKSSKESGVSYIEVLILRLLLVWLVDCPTAVGCFLDSPSHLSYLLELSSNSKSNAYVRGLVSIILGECALFNKITGEGSKDAFTVVDIISQKIGLTSYFRNFDELEETFIYFSSAPITPSKPLARSSTASATDAEDTQHDERMPGHPILFAVFNIQFIEIIKKLEIEIRESIVNVFSNPKNKVAVIPGELEQNSGEPDGQYIKRLKTFIQKQCNEMQELLARNATLAESFAQNAGISASGSVQNESSAHERVQSEMLRRNFEEATRRLETLKSEREKSEAEADLFKNLAAKMESELKSLSDAYNSLEPAYFQLESEVKALRRGGGAYADIEAIRAEAREAAEKESEAELNDLLVCLGQEQSKVEKLSARLFELGEDVDSLLEGIGDETVIQDDDD